MASRSRRLPTRDGKPLSYAPRRSDSPYGDSSGYTALVDLVEPWKPNATLDEIRRIWLHAGRRTCGDVDQILAAKKKLDYSKVLLVFQKTLLFNYEAEPLTAYQLLEGLRSELQDVPASLEQWLYTVIYYQGVTALRRGENDNCVHVPRGLLLHPPARSRRRITPIRPARGWRSATSRNISTSFPTTSKSAGCSTWPT